MSEQNSPANGDTPAERIESEAENLTETVEEAQAEIVEAVDDAADEVEEVIETSAEEVEESIEEQAEEVAAATGLDEATVRAMIREELDSRLNPPPAEEPTQTVVHETTTITDVPTETVEPEPDVAPVVGGSFAARFLAPRRKG